MSFSLTQHEQNTDSRVELDPAPPAGYVRLKAIASNGKLVGECAILEELDSLPERQMTVDRMWGAIRRYEAIVAASGLFLLP
jgi:hypothetical protein